MFKLLTKIKKYYKDGFFHIMVGNTLIRAVAFISSLVIVRLVDKHSFAYLSYVNNLYSYVALFSGLGLSSALLKFCSSTSSSSMNKAYLKFALKFGSLFQLILSLLLLIYVYVAEIPFPEARSLTLLFVLTPTFSYILQTIQSYVRSQRNNRLYAQIGVSQTIIVFIFSILFVLMFGINGVPAARYLGVIFALLISLKFIKKSFENSTDIELETKQIKSFIIMGKSLMIANLFSMIMPLNELFLVNNILRDEVVTANYKIAMLIPSQLSFITGSIMVYYFPIIARIQNNKKLLRVSFNIQLVTGLIIGIISIIGYYLTPIIIRTVYGDIYSDAIGLSKLFWIVYASNAGLRMIPMNIMPAIGRVKFNERMAIITSIVHVFIDYVLILNWGISGAVYATMSVYIITGFIYWIYLLKICKDDKDANIVI